MLTNRIQGPREKILCPNTSIVGHKIFFSPAPVRASTLSRGCAAPAQSLSGSEQSLSEPEQPGRARFGSPFGASLWAPKLGYSCRLLPAFQPSLLPEVQSSPLPKVQLSLVPEVQPPPLIYR
jgi:hypothetical protein